MATGPLRFRTPHIEELPVVHSRHAPGFSYVTVVGPTDDPSKNWGTTNRKRARQVTQGQTEQQREALTARQQREVERRIRDLNNDQTRSEVPIPVASKKASSAGGIARAGKTTNTKKILSSGKTFAHYLDDEEAEIARTGKRDGDIDVAVAVTQQRPTKTPIARRKIRDEHSVSGSPAPVAQTIGTLAATQIAESMFGSSHEGQGEDHDDTSVLPTVAEIEALLNAPSLTFNQARSGPPPADAPRPRQFCESCGYWGRVKCVKCGVTVCSVECKDIHDQFKCLKMYA